MKLRMSNTQRVIGVMMALWVMGLLLAQHTATAQQQFVIKPIAVK
jgi:hypothetical protein